MWLFDFMRVSSRFAKWIKLMCEKENITINNSKILNGNELLNLFVCSVQIYQWEVVNPWIHRSIVKDILFCLQRKFSAHTWELDKLSLDEQDNLMIKLFWNIHILDLTKEILVHSALSNGINPDQVFWDQDIQIIKEIYWN